MKIGKIVRCAALGALVLSAIPYKYNKDEKTGEIEIRSLLWGLKKTPRSEGETKDHFKFAMPASGLDVEDEENDAATDGETAAEDAPEI